MNIYIRELKFKKWSFVLWTVGAILLMYMSYSKFALMTDSDAAAMRTMIDAMPDAIKAVYGIGDFDISTLLGYTAVLINMVLIMFGLHGLFLGMSHKRLEDKNKTLDFLYTKPIAKGNILRYKVFAGITILVLFNLIISTITVAIVSNYGNLELGFYVGMAISFVLTDFVFYAVGVLISVTSKKKKYAGRGALIFFVFYIISVLSSFSESVRVLKYFTPLGILSGESVANGMNIIPVILLFALSLGMIVYSLKAVSKREVL